MRDCPAPPNPEPQISVQGTLERILFHDATSHYSVARLTIQRWLTPPSPAATTSLTIVGPLLQPQEGQTLRIQGTWTQHPKYGKQLKIETYEEVRPTSVSGIEAYLASGLIPGVGAKTARRIVKQFGDRTLEILDHQIDRLSDVPGLSKKARLAIQNAWPAHAVLKEVMIFLQGHGVSPTYAIKIFQEYGPEAIATVSDNPYRLAQDIQGIGFTKADGIARQLGFSPDADFRYQSGILHVLREAADDGHCHLPEADLLRRCRQRLSLPGHIPTPIALTTALQTLISAQQLIHFTSSDLPPPTYALPHFHRAEQRLAKRLRALLSIPLPVDRDRFETWLHDFTQTNGLPLSEQQHQAVETAAYSRVMILTGLPGTGKTFTTRAIVSLWQALGKQVALAAPTGRAAQRLSEMTGEAASTVHRLLEVDPKTLQFRRDEDNPIPATAIAVDEASMLDLFLATGLLHGIGLGSQLLLVGDTDQLPSVGPGNVLHDLIASGQIPVIRLSQIFRQAQASAIITNAHRINQGQLPQLTPLYSSPGPPFGPPSGPPFGPASLSSDCLWLAAPHPEAGVQAICDLLLHFLPPLGYDPIQHVQVLSPMLRGEVGTQNLNTVLQALLNPPHPHKTELLRGDLRFRQGDRVIQRVNNYGLEVFNGDLGRIDQIDSDESMLRVRFETARSQTNTEDEPLQLGEADRRIEYSRDDLQQLALAYAITIHKSQGSEYPVVILPLYSQHSIMLNRNLIYTGLTRARQLAIFVGPETAIRQAVYQVRQRDRYTHLTHWLTTPSSPKKPKSPKASPQQFPE